MNSKMSLVFILFISLFLNGNYSFGNGSDEDTSPTTVDVYARVLYRDDLINPIRYFMEIKIRDSSFPTIKSEGIESEMNIHALVRIRGVYAPSELQMRNRSRPHVFVDRERERFNETMTQIWKLLSSSEYLILRNVNVDKKIPAAESMTEHRGFVADIYYVTGGVQRNLRDDLIADGYAVSNDFTADFGMRLP